MPEDPTLRAIVEGTLAPRLRRFPPDQDDPATAAISMSYGTSSKPQTPQSGLVVFLECWQCRVYCFGEFAKPKPRCVGNSRSQLPAMCVSWPARVKIRESGNDPHNGLAQNCNESAYMRRILE